MSKPDGLVLVDTSAWIIGLKWNCPEILKKILKVLKGAKDLIGKNSIDFIQFEFGGANIDSRTYFQDFYYLLTPYYKIYRILKDGLIAIDAYKEIYEIFLTTNFLAILKKDL